MWTMNHTNMTQTTLNSSAGTDTKLVTSEGSTEGNNEYLYILIVMSFYGIFLMGIMLGYMRSKRKEKNSNLLLLYKDQEREWEESLKPLPAMAGLRPVPVPKVLSILQERMGPAMYCAGCTMEGSSLSSESSTPEVHFTIHEETTDRELENASQTLLHESSDEYPGNTRLIP